MYYSWRNIEEAPHAHTYMQPFVVMWRQCRLRRREQEGACRHQVTGRREKNTQRAPPATSKKELQLQVQLQQQQTQLQQIQSQVAGTSFCFPLLSFR
jgi:hypothetical protein